MTETLAERVRRDLLKNRSFHEKLMSPFTKALSRYELLAPGDHVAVCISGGKDSMLMAVLFSKLQSYSKIPFDVTFLVMDPGYRTENRRLLEENAAKLGIDVKIFETQIFEAVDHIDDAPCYLCARMRRGALYSQAKELGCNKIALGHHYDDVIETTLMGMLWSGQIQTMMPKLKSTNFEGMELIRPLYLIREQDIKDWCAFYDLHFLRCACRLTEAAELAGAEDVSVSKRLETKRLIAELKKTNPDVETNIFNSMKNVTVNMVLEYKKDGVRHSFLEEFSKEN